VRVAPWASLCGGEGHRTDGLPRPLSSAPPWSLACVAVRVPTPAVPAPVARTSVWYWRSCGLVPHRTLWVPPLSCCPCSSSFCRAV